MINPYFVLAKRAVESGLLTNKEAIWTAYEMSEIFSLCLEKGKEINELLSSEVSEEEEKRCRAWITLWHDIAMNNNNKK